MGYRNNPELVEQRMYLLEPLLSGENCYWSISPPTRDEAENVAFKIREALRIARQWKNRFPDLAKIANEFSIHVVGPGRLEGRRKTHTRVETGELGAPTQGLEPFGKEVPQDHLFSADQVIASWRLHQPSNDPLSFTHTALSYEEMVKLWTWCQAQVPKLVLLASDERLTVSLKDPTIEEFTWKPTVPPEVPRAAPPGDHNL